MCRIGRGGEYEQISDTTPTYSRSRIGYLPLRMFGFLFLLCLSGAVISYIWCEHVGSSIETICPPNGNCSVPGTVSIAKYQYCGGDHDHIDMTRPGWCSRLNCSLNFCAEYILDCRIDLAQGMQCVELQSKSNGWCTSSQGFLFLFAVCTVMGGIAAFVFVLQLFLAFALFQSHQ